MLQAAAFLGCNAQQKGDKDPFWEGGADRKKGISDSIKCNGIGGVEGRGEDGGVVFTLILGHRCAARSKFRIGSTEVGRLA